ncbi:MAG: PIN domain-containing protein [Candidatus Lokiarchaeota archaeon]|nr:PIN domain-containing protein [Candidatus Lokiarchaeota archaeon]
MKGVVVDSNVFIASLIENDKFYEVSIDFIEKMNINELIFHISMIIPIEVSCAIARRIGAKEANESEEIIHNWIKEKKIVVYELNEKRMTESQNYGTKYKLKGMDAIIIQLALELNLPLITFDNEIIERAKDVQFFKS